MKDSKENTTNTNKVDELGEDTHVSKGHLMKLHLQDNIHEILTEEDVISHSAHKEREQMFLLIRNGLVLVAAVLFITSLFFHDAQMLRGIAYILGAIAYFAELLLLTDCFRNRVPHDELFMIYVFGPLYILMGIGYFLE